MIVILTAESAFTTIIPSMQYVSSSLHLGVCYRSVCYRFWNCLQKSITLSAALTISNFAALRLAVCRRRGPLVAVVREGGHQLRLTSCGRQRKHFSTAQKTAEEWRSCARQVEDQALSHPYRNDDKRMLSLINGMYPRGVVLKDGVNSNYTRKPLRLLTFNPLVHHWTWNLRKGFSLK